MALIESTVRINNHPLFAAFSGITDPTLNVTFNMDEKELIVLIDTITVNGNVMPLPTDTQKYLSLALIATRVQNEVEKAIRATFNMESKN